MAASRSKPETQTPPPNGVARKLSAYLVGNGSLDGLLPHLEEAGIAVSPTTDGADLVLAYGGDGSVLGAVREFPDLPILPIRRDEDYVKCPRHRNYALLRRVAQGEQEITLLPRLCAEFRGQKIYAVNDIVFHNALVQSAVRYRLRIDGDPYSNEIVGDGIVVATPFGSSAYYRSITNSLIRVGVGLAFNNSTEATNHLVLGDDSLIDVEVTRGPAILMGDNMREPISAETGDHIHIRLSSQKAVIWELGGLTCKLCKERDSGKPAGWRHA